MGDADYGGDDYGDYFFEDDWLYIEDELAAADELAESQIPSPGYSGTNAELMLEWYEYDTYEYFGELEYGSDSYWDTRLAKENFSQEQKHEGNQSPRKRKRTSSTSHTDKRRRIDSRRDIGGEQDWQGVIFRSEPKPSSVPSVSQETVTFALFPDWRDRFVKDVDEVWHSAMPEDMKRAAEINVPVTQYQLQEDKQAEDDLENAGHRTGHSANKSKHSGAAMQAQDVSSAMDHEALRTVLRSKLGDAGLDEEAFMSVINDMLAGDDAADDAIARLASTLLDREGDNNATAAWLQNRGVNMTESAEEAETVDPATGNIADEETGDLHSGEAANKPPSHSQGHHRRSGRSRKQA